MKKTISIVLILMVVFNALILTSCDMKDTTVNIGFNAKESDTATANNENTNENTNGSNTNNNNNNNSNNSNNNNNNNNSNNSNSNEDNFISPTSYKTPYNVKACDTELVHKYSDNINNYFVYKIGEIETVPLQIWGHQGHDGITETTVQVTTGQVMIDNFAASESLMVTTAVSTELSSKLSSKVESSVNATYNDSVSAGAKSSVEAEVSASVSTSVTNANSKMVSQSIENQISKERVEGYIVPKDAPAGHYYKAVTCACDVYVTIICNIDEKTYSYIYSTLVLTDTIVANDRFYSESQILKPSESEVLNFDDSVIDGIDLFGDINEEFITEIIDFSLVYFNSLDETVSLKENKNQIPSKFQGNYDSETGVFKLYSKVNGKDVDRYIIKGLYGGTDPNTGYTYNTVITNLSFDVFSTHDMEIVFDCFAYRASSGSSALFFDEHTSSDITVTIKSTGKKNEIQGMDQIYTRKDINDGNEEKKEIKPTVDASAVRSVVFMGKAPLTIAGATSYSKKEDITDTYDGGMAILARNIIVDMSSDITLSIRGGDGSTASDRDAWDNDGDNSDGKDGYDGGNGGIAMSIESITIKSGICRATGGSGGNGGAGSEGNGNWLKDRVGGDGGKGGDGAYGIMCASDTQVRIDNGNLTVSGGNGGNGGTRGGIHNNGSPGRQGIGGVGESGFSNKIVLSGDNACGLAIYRGSDGSDGTGTNQD